MTPRIRMVQIKNYKSLSSVSVELEPFTVFVGPNGSGKSNFLDALAFLQESTAESMELAIKRRGGMSQIINALENYRDVLKFPPAHVSDTERKQILKRSVESVASFGVRLVLDLPNGHRADYSVLILKGEWDRFVIGRERCVVVDASGQRHGFETYAGEFVQGLEGIAPVVFTDRLTLFAASATPQFRPVYDFISCMMFYSIAPHLLRNLQDPDVGYYLKRDGSNAASVLKNFIQYSQQPEKVEQLWNLLGRVTGGITKVAPWEVGPKQTLIFLQDVGIETPTNFVALNMSDGTLRALGVLLALYQLGNPPVVGIEEPEATVHPALSEMMFQVLMDAANERQVLVTTHSADILDQKELSDSQIRVLQWENGRSIVAPVSRASREAIRERLYTAGELLRVDELSADLEKARKASDNVDLFGEPFPEET